MSPYRQPAEPQPSGGGRWVYGPPDTCPYCQKRVKTVVWRAPNALDRAHPDYNFAEWCAPYARLLLVAERHWYGDKRVPCPEPGHHVHMMCGFCYARWLYKIEPAEVSQTK